MIESFASTKLLLCLSKHKVYLIIFDIDTSFCINFNRINFFGYYLKATIKLNPTKQMYLKIKSEKSLTRNFLSCNMSLNLINHILSREVEGMAL